MRTKPHTLIMLNKAFHPTPYMNSYFEYLVTYPLLIRYNHHLQKCSACQWREIKKKAFWVMLCSRLTFSFVQLSLPIPPVKNCELQSDKNCAKKAICICHADSDCNRSYKLKRKAHLIGSLKFPQTEFFPALIKPQTQFLLLIPVNLHVLQH